MTDNKVHNVILSEEITDEFMREVDDDYIAKMLLKYDKGYFILLSDRGVLNFRTFETIYKHNKDFLFQLIDISWLSSQNWMSLLILDKDGEFIDHINSFNTIGELGYRISLLIMCNSITPNQIDKLITMVKRVNINENHNWTTRQYIIDELEEAKSQHYSLNQDIEK